VYVRPFPGPGGRTQISTDPGSSDPLWSRDGRELFYRSPTYMIAARLRDGALVARDTLFADDYARELGHPGYDVMPDGQHFLMTKPADAESRVLLVVHWLDELRDRLAAAERR